MNNHSCQGKTSFFIAIFRSFPWHLYPFIYRHATVARTTPKWLNRAEQNALLRTVRKYGNLRDLTLVTFLLHTGLRVAEVADVTVNDISITERMGMVIVRKGKHNRYREVPLNKDIRRLLTQYMDASKCKDGYLFSNRQGDRITTRAIELIIEKYKKFAELPDLTCHTLRHTFAHELILNKVPLDVVARLLGHMNQDGSPRIEQTLVYTTPGREDLQNAVEALNWT